MAAFKRKNLDKASQMIAECGQYWSGYNRELLAGDICYYMEEYPDAITHYEMAQDMCPVRFAPLEGLYKVYDAIGDDPPPKKSGRPNRYEACEGQLSGRDENKKEVQIKIT